MHHSDKNNRPLIGGGVLSQQRTDTDSRGLIVASGRYPKLSHKNAFFKFYDQEQWELFVTKMVLPGQCL